MVLRVPEFMREKYDAHLASPEWREMRVAAIERAQGQCALCMDTRHLHVHHRTYDRLGCESPDDLIVLCEWCHSAAHFGGMAVEDRPKRIDWDVENIRDYAYVGSGATECPQCECDLELLAGRYGAWRRCVHWPLCDFKMKVRDSDVAPKSECIDHIPLGPFDGVVARLASKMSMPP